jgi:non-specific serine/threonine protein kinase
LKDGDMIRAINHWAQAHASKPDDPEIMVYLSLGYDIVGKDDIARSLVEKCAKIDPINPLNEAIAGWNHFFGGRFDLALDSLFAAYNLSPENPMHQYFKALILVYNDQAEEAYDFICQNIEEPSENIWSQVTIFLKYIIKRDKNKLNSLLTTDFVTKIQRDLQYSYHIATFYAYLDDKKESFKWLENAISRGFINYPLLNKRDKLLVNIRGEERFKKLMERVKYEWENFEV